MRNVPSGPVSLVSLENIVVPWLMMLRLVNLKKKKKNTPVVCLFCFFLLPTLCFHVRLYVLLCAATRKRCRNQMSSACNHTQSVTLISNTRVNRLTEMARRFQHIQIFCACVFVRVCLRREQTLQDYLADFQPDTKVCDGLII